MDYEKTNWIDNKTPINAKNLNKIENGIASVAKRMDEIVINNKEIEDKTKNTYSANIIDKLLEEATPTEVYSTTETKIGTWIDEKPVYEKVFSFSNVSGGSDTSIGTIDNLDNLVLFYGTIYVSGLWLSLPRVNTADFRYQASLHIDTSDNKVYVSPGQYSRIEKGSLVVRYTKTTD